MSEYIEELKELYKLAFDATTDNFNPSDFTAEWDGVKYTLFKEGKQYIFKKSPDIQSGLSGPYKTVRAAIWFNFEYEYGPIYSYYKGRLIAKANLYETLKQAQCS